MTEFYAVKIWHTENGGYGSPAFVVAPADKQEKLQAHFSGNLERISHPTHTHLRHFVPYVAEGEIGREIMGRVISVADDSELIQGLSSEGITIIARWPALTNSTYNKVSEAYASSDTRLMLAYNSKPLSMLPNIFGGADWLYRPRYPVTVSDIRVSEPALA